MRRSSGIPITAVTASLVVLSVLLSVPGYLHGANIAVLAVLFGAADGIQALAARSLAHRLSPKANLLVSPLIASGLVLGSVVVLLCLHVEPPVATMGTTAQWVAEGCLGLWLGRVLFTGVAATAKRAVGRVSWR